jgi:choline dehydrogenase-like flavoprotein
MINQLVSNNNPVEVQETDFSIDVLGRYICNTWDEAINNGGRPFDAVVIGGGMFGAYCAEKIYRKGNMRVLVLDAGSFLVSEHVQNLARIGLNTAGAIKVASNSEDPGTRERVWGNAWRSNTPFPGMAYCLGGRSLYWGGWSPRLTEADFVNWPTEIVDYLKGIYSVVEAEIGTSEKTDYISGPLYEALKQMFKDAVATTIPTVDAIEDAPLAVQGSAPASGLFSFDKYSSAPLLVDAIREASVSPDNERKLFYVPRTHVVKLHTSGDTITAIEVRVNGQTKLLNLAPHCAVILANGTIESTRLAMESFPTESMGKNLVGHLRSNTVVRIHRSAFPSTLPQQLETAALLVRGATPEGRYHIQVTAAAIKGANSEAAMFRMIPDIELLAETLSSQSEDWIVITLRGIGEMKGDKNATVGNMATSWMNLSPFEKDQFGFARAWVHLVKTNIDGNVWDTMDEAALQLAIKLASDDTTKIQYFYNKDGSLNAPGATWHNDPPPISQSNDRNNPNNKVRDGLGTTHHESGTLWMGEDPNTSVTDLNGKFHHIRNAYVAGSALFPALGSANPSLTALALCRKTTSAVTRELKPVIEPDYIPLLDGILDNVWEEVGSGKFQRFGNVIESDGGTGLYLYKKEKFKNFSLKLDWRVMNMTDNSGVYVRVPEIDKTDPQWLQKANTGWEVQIDERGFNSNTNTENDPLKLTGAIYDVAPAVVKASRPVCEWNTYEIEVKDQSIKVLLNGIPVSEVANDPQRPQEGYIGLQNHHPGSRVQFGNVRIKKLV